MRYAFVRDEAKTHAVEQLCDLMEVSRSGYYAWESRPECKLTQDHQRLIPKIQKLFTESRETYGYRRITDGLKKQGENCGKHRTASLMRKLDLNPFIKRRFKITTNSNHDKPIYNNVLNRQFNPSKMNQAWSSDITYIATDQGWLYLAVVMDLYSRTIVGWAMDKHMTESLVMNALAMALFRRKISAGLLLHSDRGSQYASNAYQQLLKQHHIICSMSRKGNCWDNSPMESFFRSLKTESIYRQTFKTREQAKLTVFDYIEVFYNRQRAHSTLHYLSPMNFELAYANS
jgi:putative transposase